MRRRNRLTVAASVMVALIVSASALGGGAATSTPTVVKTAFNKKLGATIVVDAKGRTLYMFTSDPPGKSDCTVENLNCSGIWPPLITKGKPRAGKGIVRAKLGTFRRRNGQLQVTYNRHALYRYIDDKKPGDVLGQKWMDLWYVLSPGGTPIGK